MGTTLANVGPQAGQAAQGFMQGRQMRTQEDTSRQTIALRAAEEGRAKEQHRLSIQQLGLQIQGMMQAQSQAEQMFPKQLEAQEQGLEGGRDAADPYEQSVQGILGPGFSKNIQPGMTRDQFDSSAGMYLKDRGYDLAGARANSADAGRESREDVQWARIQAQNIRDDIKSKRLDKKAVELSIKQLRDNMSGEEEIAEAEAELQLITDEIRLLDENLLEYTSNLGPKSGVASPAPKRSKLAPPPMVK